MKLTGMKPIMLIKTMSPPHNQSGSSSTRSLFEESSRGDINNLYDKMIKETNKVLSKIKNNHRRIMSNDYNNNSRNKCVVSQFSITNDFMNAFKAKKIDNKTMEHLLKEINHESTEKKKKYSTLFNNLQKETKNINLKKNHQYTSLRLSKSKSKLNTLKSQKIISPSSSSNKMISLQSTKNNSMKNSESKMIINKSTKSLFQSQNLALVNKNYSTSVQESLHLETTDEKAKNENIALSNTSYKFNLISDIEKQQNNLNHKNVLNSQNYSNSQNEVDLKGTKKLIRTNNNTTTQTINKNTFMNNYCTYEKTESNLIKHNCGCNIINNFFCYKF